MPGVAAFEPQNVELRSVDFTLYTIQHVFSYFDVGHSLFDILRFKNHGTFYCIQGKSRCWPFGFLPSPLPQFFLYGVFPYVTY